MYVYFFFYSVCKTSLGEQLKRGETGSAKYQMGRSCDMCFYFLSIAWFAHLGIHCVEEQSQEVASVSLRVRRHITVG